MQGDPLGHADLRQPPFRPDASGFMGIALGLPRQFGQGCLPQSGYRVRPHSRPHVITHTSTQHMRVGESPATPLGSQKGNQGYEPALEGGWEFGPAGAAAWRGLWACGPGARGALQGRLSLGQGLPGRLRRHVKTQTTGATGGSSKQHPGSSRHRDSHPAGEETPLHPPGRLKCGWKRRTWLSP